MATLNLSKTVADILKTYPERYFTARELAQEVFKIKPQECAEKMAKSNVINNEEGLLNQIVAEIGANKDALISSNIKMTAERPKKYYYSEKTDAEEIAEIEKVIKHNQQPEHDSYPLLCQYLYYELGICPKRIDEKKSSNTKGKNGNMWLHPDVVGLKNLSDGWCADVVSCANKHAFNKTSLWAFEVKLKINLSNVREYFFQTVSNSSWANYSYLVAQEIDDRAMDELRILCNRHKVGVIKLEKDNPTDSQILIPAPEKTSLDWDMIDRIVRENSDFKEFIGLVTEFYQTDNKIKERDWDIPKI